VSEWIAARERGSSWTIAFMVWLCRGRQRWLVRLLLRPVVLYFLLTGRAARRASLEYFTRVKGSAGWRDCYRQLLCFAECLVDRVTLLTGEVEPFTVRSQGREQLQAMQRNGRGFILLGSHLGSFEASRLLVHEKAGIDVHIVAYHAGSTRIRQALDAINPALADKVIDPAHDHAVFQMRDVIEAGGVLAILGDRTGIGEKKLPVEFLGRPTRLPAGPYYLAAILHCPVYCFFGVRTGDRVYDVSAVRLADEIHLARGQREQQAQHHAQRYADLLAEKARQHPYNWFNFYGFWDDVDAPIQDETATG
jgi:predicted LPLAT superfamily acyltransferase